jgi:hypothetical protein
MNERTKKTLVPSQWLVKIEGDNRAKSLAGIPFSQGGLTWRPMIHEVREVFLSSSIEEITTQEERITRCPMRREGC